MNKSDKENRFLTILENHKDQVYRICWGFTKEKSDVEDLYQEVMLKTWKGLDGFEGRSSISTWLYRVTVNTCLLWKKKNKHSIELNEKHQHKPEFISGSQEDLLIQNEKILKLKSAIQRLNKMDKTIALLILEEMSYEEISKITGLNINHIGVKIHRIKQQLKKLMQ